MGMKTSDPRPTNDSGLEPSRTKQSFKDICDINNIVKRARKTNMIDHLNAGVPRFMDVSEVTDYRSALEAVERGQEHFMGLPADVREAFDNDPATYVDFLTDPDARERLEAIGTHVLDAKKDPEKATSPADPEPVEPSSNE